MSPRSTGALWREGLIRQMIAFGDERSRFLDAYYPEYTNARLAADRLLSDYTRTLEELLKEKGEDALNRQVLIGSRVVITYLDDGSSETLMVSYPQAAALDTGMYRVSFLSPTGRSLLMRHCGDEPVVDAPSGPLRIRIDQIDFQPEELVNLNEMIS